MDDLTRPIIGIENRAAEEVFDIMCDRIRSALRAAAEREREWRRKYFAEKVDHAMTHNALAAVSEDVCGLLCPSVKKTGEEWSHVPKCQAISAALSPTPPAQENGE